MEPWSERCSCQMECRHRRRSSRRSSRSELSPPGSLEGRWRTLPSLHTPRTTLGTKRRKTSTPPSLQSTAPTSGRKLRLGMPRSHRT